MHERGANHRAGATASKHPPVVIAGPLPEPRNGMTVYTQLLLDQLDEVGFDYSHIDMSDHREISAIGRFDVRNTTLALRFWARASAALLGRPPAYYAPIAQNRLGFIRDSVPFIVARLLHVNRFVHLHGSQFATFYRETDPLTRAITRVALSGSTGIVLHQTLCNTFGPIIPSENIRVIENAVRDPGWRCERNWPPTALFLSTVSEEKGAGLYLKAATSLADTGIEFLMAGPQWPCDYLEHQEIGRVRYVGVVGAETDRQALFESAGMFVLPSFNEGQPLAILEAMAAGLPIIATDVGAVASTVTHDEGGFIVPAGDCAALASAIRRLACDEALRRRMGQFNRRVYDQRFRPERLRADFVAIVGGGGATSRLR